MVRMMLPNHQFLLLCIMAMWINCNRPETAELVCVAFCLLSTENDFFYIGCMTQPVTKICHVNSAEKIAQNTSNDYDSYCALQLSKPILIVLMPESVLMADRAQ